MTTRDNDAVRRTDRMVWIGDFFGTINDSPSNIFAIAYGGVSAQSSLQHTSYRLIADNRVVAYGSVQNRIFDGKVTDDGHFALHTIVGNNEGSVMIVFSPDGNTVAEIVSVKTVRIFEIVNGGTHFVWVSDNHLKVQDLLQNELAADFELPNRVYPDGCRHIAGQDFVEVHHPKLDWYKFSLDGEFLDEERWLNDFLGICNGNSLYHTVRDYYESISTPTPDDARTYALWVEEAVRRGIEEAFMFSLSDVYGFLAQLWSVAGDASKFQEAQARFEEHLDGFRLVDRTIEHLSQLGGPPDKATAAKLIADLDRATATKRLHEYPSYTGKLFRTKGELLEIMGDKDGAVAAYRQALDVNPKIGCKRRLEQLTGSRVVTVKKMELKTVEKKIDVESRINIKRQSMFHFRCPVCASEPGEIPFMEYLDSWRQSEPRRTQLLLVHLVVATSELKSGTSRWLTKRFLAQADKLILDVADNKPENMFDPSPFLLPVGESTMTMKTDCPVCGTVSGHRSKDNYFTIWSDACKVQSSNLYFEIGLILHGLLQSKQSWMPDDLGEYLVGIKRQCFRTGEAIGLMSCPQCGRFTSALFGATRQEPEKGFCRWCLDAGHRPT